MIAIKLGNPLGLLFLLFPLFALIVFILSKRIFKKGIKLSGISKIEKHFSIRKIFYFLSIALILISFFLMAFSLCEPMYGIKREKIVSEGIDIIIALDTSKSMLIKDYGVYSRIDLAKEYSKYFIDKRKGDRIGLVTFSTNSVLKCPATLNYNLLKKIISGITILGDKHNSTAIGVGLASAVNRLSNINEKSSNASKVIILITDGANNAGEITPEKSAEIAKEKGFKVYTVGIGKQYEVDIELLRKISSDTAGKHFYIESATGLLDVFNEIDKLEKYEIETFEFARYNSIAYIFLLYSFILMLSGLILGFIVKRVN